MIEFKETKTYQDMSFGDYLGLIGYSNSFFKFEKEGKVEPIKGSEKMAFGSLVDDLLTDPKAADLTNPRLDEAKGAAAKVIEFFTPEVYEGITKQLSMTSLMGNEREGYIPVKGRIDFLMAGCVADLKCTEAHYNQLPTLVKYMGYDKQVWFYSKMLGLDTNYGIILFYLVKSKVLVPQKVIFDGSQEAYFQSKFHKFNI